MSRSLWAIFFAAIFGITSGLGKLGPRNSPSKLEGVGSASAPGGVCGNIVKVSYRDKLQASANYGSPSNVEGARNDFVVERAAGVSPAEGVRPLRKTILAATSGTVSVKLSDLPVGKVIQIGEFKFVKVGSDQYTAVNLCPDGSTYSSYYKGCVVKTTTYSYTGNYQTFTAPATGTYVVELWGASGGSNVADYGNTQAGNIHSKGYGGYVQGIIDISTGTSLYVYVGQKGPDGLYTATTNIAWNGGGKGDYDHNSESSSYGPGIDSGEGSGAGGGGTDIRTISGVWNNDASLRSRIIVAGAGGGNSFGQDGGYGGGLTAEKAYYGSSANQTSGNAFGVGQNGAYANKNVDVAGGGGGWYGGYAKSSGKTDVYKAAGGGGSSYISGHAGCVAVTSTSSSSPKSGCATGTTNNSCSITPYVNPATGSGYTFTNTVMIDGAGYAWTNVKGSLQPMPSPESVGAYYASSVGHTGNGAARITQLSAYLGI